MRRRTLLFPLFLIAAASMLLPACKKNIDTQAMDAGLPCWISDPCCDCADGEMAGFGRSDVAAVDFNTAKGEAEALALAHVGQQLQTEVDHLMEITAEVYTDIGPDSLVDLGNRTRKQIDSSYVHQSVRGAEFTDYYYMPSLSAPETILVRAKVSVEREQFANELLDAFERELAAELELSHEENMLRLEQVRDEYLRNKATKAPATTKSKVME